MLLPSSLKKQLHPGDPLNVCHESRSEFPSALIPFLQSDFNTMLDNLNEFFFTYDLNSRITFINKKAHEAMGYTSAEMIGQPMIQFVVPEHHAMVEHHIKIFLKKGNGNSYEVEVITKNGNRLCLHVKYAPLKERERIIGGIVLAQDLTEFRRTESILRYQLEFEHLIASISGRFININSTEIDSEIERALGLIAKFLGADRSYIFLRSENGNRISNTHEWCAPDVAAFKNKFQNFNTADYPCTFDLLSKNEYVYFPSIDQLPAEVRKELPFVFNYNIRSFLVVPLFFNQNYVGLMGFNYIDTPPTCNQDVELLKIAAEIVVNALQHRRSENRIKSGLRLFDRLKEGIILFDPRGILLWSNQAFSDITGFKKNEIKSQTYDALIFIPAFDKDKCLSIREQLKKSGKWQGRITALRKNGETFTSLVSISVIKKSAEVQNYFAIFVDTTEQMKLKQERAQLKKQTFIAQRLASLSTLSAGIVHEIAQPLNTIKVLVDGMLYWHQTGKPLETDEIFKKLKDISLETERINETIKYIRSFASFKEDKLTTCNLNRSVMQSLNLLGRQLTGHEISVKLSLAEDLPQVYGNPSRLEEIIINLLDNAMHALIQSDRKSKIIECTTFTSDKDVVLEVSDNATGIDSNIIGCIFEPFVTQKNSDHGMGLGLTIVHTIISSLQGKVTAYNNKMGGATFRIELPSVNRRSDK